MKLTEQHIFKGYWWLPDNPQNKVAGVLTYSPGERILLELIGAFESKDGAPKDFFVENDESVPLILGIDSDAKEMSLISCNSSFSYNFSSSFPIMHYTAQMAVYDKHIRGLDEICQYTAHVRFPELSYWALPFAINQTIHFNPEGNEIYSCSINIPFSRSESNTICSINCENGVCLSIECGVAYQAGDMLLKPELEQYSFLKISKPQNGISINEILKEIHKFSQFLSLATKRNVLPESIFLTDPDVRQDFKDGTKSIYFPVYILLKQPVPYNQTKLNRDRFLFRYEEFPGIIPVLISNWMSDSDKLQPIKSHLVDSLIYKPVVGSVDYLQVVQAIEGVWWRFYDDKYKADNHIGNKKQTSLETILEELLKSLSTIPATSKLNIDIKAAVDSRVYYTHFVDKCKRPKVLDGWNLYKLTKKMRCILLCLVLRLLGTSDNDIETIISH